MMQGNDVGRETKLTPNEKLEYETCTSLIKHYETIRMGMLQFFAAFNGILFGFLTWLFSSTTSVKSVYFGVGFLTQCVFFLFQLFFHQ